MPLFKGGDIFISAFILPTNGGPVYCSEVAMLESYSSVYFIILLPTFTWLYVSHVYFLLIGSLVPRQGPSPVRKTKNKIDVMDWTKVSFCSQKLYLN